MSDHHTEETPEDAANKLEQQPAVDIVLTGPYYNRNSSNRLIFESIDDLYKYGSAYVGAPGAFKMFLVVDNTEASDLQAPGFVHIWIGERFHPDNKPGIGGPNAANDVVFTPLYKRMVEWKAEDSWYLDAVGQPTGTIPTIMYKGIMIYMPDPRLDYSRPTEQIEATTGNTSGVTVTTTNKEIPGAAGVITTSETASGIDPQEGAQPTSNFTTRYKGKVYNVAELRVLLAGGTVDLRDKKNIRKRIANLERLNNKNLPREFFIGDTSVDAETFKAYGARDSNGNATINIPPCDPDTTGIGSGSIPPQQQLKQDASLRRARAASVAESVNYVQSGYEAANAPYVAPTVVTQSTLQNNNTSSDSDNKRPTNAYIYKPLTSGFDRYDFNTGKKVYTPDSGPSRNVDGNTLTPQGTPRVSPNANKIGPQ